MAKFYSKRNLTWVRDHWGKEDEAQNLDPQMIEKNFVRMMKKDDWILDDQTWNDLDMNKNFAKMNRTYSNAGQQQLYNMLRILKFDEEELKRRDRLITYFQMNKEQREQIQCLMRYIGKEEYDSGCEVLYGEEQELPPGRAWVMPATLGMIASILSIPFLKFGAIFLIVIFMIMNLLIHSYFSKYTERGLNGIRSVSRMLRIAKEITRLDIPELKEGYNDFFAKAIDKCGVILRKNRALGIGNGGDPFGLGLYLQILFLVEERAYLRCVKDIRQMAPVLRTVYRRIGELDAFQSVASVRRSMVPFTRPTFVDKPNYFSAETMGHPTLKNAVCNSITLDRRNMVLTGSNMSGKSTFLRTIGMNVLLAQTFYMAKAKHLELCFFNLATSISPSDDMSSGKSYYMAEAQALLRMLGITEEKRSSLLLIDEIFRGTNPMERVAAASSLLTYLSKRNCLTIVATHDAEITENVREFYENYHFEETVTKDALEFDYLLKPGILKKPNGIHILEYIGYPEEITRQALESVRMGSEPKKENEVENV